MSTRTSQVVIAVFAAMMMVLPTRFAVAADDPVEEAMQRGDLSSAKAEAARARKANPTPDNWLREATVLERAGDHRGAIRAYRGHLSAGSVTAKQRNFAEGRIRELQSASRGTVADEPASTHRKGLDAKWKSSAPRAKKRPKPAAQPVSPRQPKDEKIVRKWYFWVTLVAITAAAGAITGIAIKAARQDPPDSLDMQMSPASGPALLRF